MAKPTYRVSLLMDDGGPVAKSAPPSPVETLVRASNSREAKVLTRRRYPICRILDAVRVDDGRRHKA